MTIVFKVSDNTKEKMIEYYMDLKRDKTPPYAVFQAEEGGTIITLYESGKVMFQGISADVDANMWKETEAHLNGGVMPEEQKKKEKEKKDEHELYEERKKYYYINSIGSDEVGTGDYFGPIVVTASFVKKDDIEFLENLGIKDSKKLTDDKILEIAPKVAKQISYKSIILTNKEYNEKHAKDNNMNKIKSIMHNKVLYQMVQSTKESYDYIIVDEFAKEARYYDYIKESTEIQRGITFMTKAEDKNLAVACSSVISRYIFLKEFDKLSDSLHIPLVKGAGELVDKVGEEVVEKYGPDKLKEVAKLNFRNTERILHTRIV